MADVCPTCAFLNGAAPSSDLLAAACERCEACGPEEIRDQLRAAYGPDAGTWCRSFLAAFQQAAAGGRALDLRVLQDRSQDQEEEGRTLEAGTAFSGALLHLLDSIFSCGTAGIAMATHTLAAATATAGEAVQVEMAPPEAGGTAAPPVAYIDAAYGVRPARRWSAATAAESRWFRAALGLLLPASQRQGVRVRLLILYGKSATATCPPEWCARVAPSAFRLQASHPSPASCVYGKGPAANALMSTAVAALVRAGWEGQPCPSLQQGLSHLAEMALVEPEKQLGRTKLRRLLPVLKQLLPQAAVADRLGVLEVALRATAEAVVQSRVQQQREEREAAKAAGAVAESDDDSSGDEIPLHAAARKA